MSFSSVSWDISAGNGHDREEALKRARTSKTVEALMCNVSPIQRLVSFWSNDKDLKTGFHSANRRTSQQISGLTVKTKVGKKLYLIHMDKSYSWDFCRKWAWTPFIAKR